MWPRDIAAEMVSRKMGKLRLLYNIGTLTVVALCLSLRVRGITQLLPLLSHSESFYAFFFFVSPVFDESKK